MITQLLYRVLAIQFILFISTFSLDLVIFVRCDRRLAQVDASGLDWPAGRWKVGDYRRGLVVAVVSVVQLNSMSEDLAVL